MTILGDLNRQRSILLANGAREPMRLKIGAAKFRALCDEVGVDTAAGLAETLGMSVEVERDRAGNRRLTLIQCQERAQTP